MTLSAPEGPPPMFEEPRRVLIHLGREGVSVTYFLLGLSVLVYLGQMLSQALWGEDLVALWMMKIPAELIVHTGQWWRLWTPLLVHGGLLHLGFNMYALYLYGPILERLLGRGWFLALYLTAGLWGNAFSAVFTRDASVGASTAIFGLFAALWMLMRRHQDILGLWGKRVMEQTWTLIAINLLLGFVLPQVDNWGHIGGALGGLAFILVAGPLWRLEPYPEGEVRQQEQTSSLSGHVVLMRLRDERPWMQRGWALLGLWVLSIGMVVLSGL